MSQRGKELKKKGPRNLFRKFKKPILNPKTRQIFDKKSLDYLIKSPKCDDPLKKKRRSGLKP